MYSILNIDICSSLVRIDYVAMKPEWKLDFFLQKTLSSVLSLVPWKTKNHILGLWNSKNFLEEHAPRPP